jgi:hypothetical protein
MKFHDGKWITSVHWQSEAVRGMREEAKDQSNLTVFKFRFRKNTWLNQVVVQFEI